MRFESYLTVKLKYFFVKRISLNLTTSLKSSIDSNLRQRDGLLQQSIRVRSKSDSNNVGLKNGFPTLLASCLPTKEIKKYVRKQPEKRYERDKIIARSCCLPNAVC